MTGFEFLNILCSSDSILGLSDKSSDDSVWRATVLKWLNLVLADIQNRQQSFHWRWLERTDTMETVVGQHSYDPPPGLDTNKLLSMYERTNDITYTYMPYQKFVRLVADPSNNIGTPARYFTYYAGDIRLYPVPSEVITVYLDYVRNITQLTDDNSIACDVPIKYDPVIIDGVLSYIFRFDPQLGDLQTQIQTYEAGIRRMITDNNMMPAELAQPTSHRERMLRGTDVDGRNSLYFPTADF